MPTQIGTANSDNITILMAYTTGGYDHWGDYECNNPTSQTPQKVKLNTIIETSSFLVR